MTEPERTPDGRYIIVDGRRWRASDPGLAPERRDALVRELMDARRAVGAAKRAGDATAERAARDRVHAAKVALGERGTPPWWEQSDDERAARWMAQVPVPDGHALEQ
jgi:hypothetical protein